jgi:hypothetical protein
MIHDAAFAGATAITDLVQPQSGEVHEFHRQAYRIISNAIQEYETQRCREAERLAPSGNLRLQPATAELVRS